MTIKLAEGLECVGVRGLPGCCFFFFQLKIKSNLTASMGCLKLIPEFFLTAEKSVSGILKVDGKSCAGVKEVYFDDFKVTHTKSPVIQSDDYYPFGLTFNSYSRENSTPNKFKFQSQEHIDDLDLGWDSFKWRNHMPDIGRFFNVDPIAEDYYYNSPYAFSENKVVAHIELEGLEAVSIGALLKQAVTIVTTIVNHLFGGDEVTPESAGQVNQAYSTMPAVIDETQKMRTEIEGTLGQVPALGSAMSITAASQAETTGETMQHLGEAASKANSIPVVSGNSGGRGSNKLKADTKATGPHSTFKTDNNSNIYKYETYEQTRTGDFNPVKRFDGGKPDGSPGAPHINKQTKEPVSTPHVQGKDIPGGVRKPTPDEIPNNKRFNNGNN